MPHLRYPSYCRPTDHVVTVMRARRLRDGLSTRWWIRCRQCDLQHGPYTDWHAAWLDAWNAQIATRRRGEPSPLAGSSRVGA